MSDAEFRQATQRPEARCSAAAAAAPRFPGPPKKREGHNRRGVGRGEDAHQDGRGAAPAVRGGEGVSRLLKGSSGNEAPLPERHSGTPRVFPSKKTHRVSAPAIGSSSPSLKGA